MLCIQKKKNYPKKTYHKFKMTSMYKIERSHMVFGQITENDKLQNIS